MNKGKFIVIEGADAAGKHTQTKLLVDRAKSEGYRVAATAFPRYETPIGKEIQEYLHGKYGTLEKVDTKFASLLYMIDRHEAQPWIQHTLKRVDLLISDRYSDANIAHQAAKETGRKRRELIKWLYEFEHSAPFNHEMPNHVVYLDLPPEFARHAMEAEGRKQDIHEKNIAYQRNVRKIFLAIAAGNPDIRTVINCLKDKHTRFYPEEISDQIWSIVKPRLTKAGTQIYLAAPIRGDGADRDELRRIGSVLERYGKILTPHVMSDNVRQEEDAKRAIGTNILERDLDLLDHANVLMAEVTTSGSYGIGREIEYATNALQIPTIALFNVRKRNFSDVSGMITDDKRVTVVPYTSETLDIIVASIMSDVDKKIY